MPRQPEALDPVSIYFAEIGRYELLSKPEEKIAKKQVERLLHQEVAKFRQTLEI